ncbi:response regulator transcription factor [Thomasclavelia sp.]
MRLLIIEDNEELSELMVENLNEYNYACDIALYGEQADLKINDNSYDAILLDLNLPDIDGFDLLKMWRKNNLEAPILVVSARNEIEERVKGLQLGGDDYITKPFDFTELHARIQAVIRRFRGRPVATINVAGLYINPNTRTVSLDGTKISLSPKEYDILEYIASQHPKIISNFEIAEHVYNEDFDPFSGVIRVHMANIRKKLMINGKSILCNLKGKGYFLCHP